MNCKLLSSLFVLAACGQSPKDPEIPSNKVSQSPVSKISDYSSGERAIAFLDSAYRATKHVEFLKKMDSIACSSDGDLSEQVDVVAVGMYSIDGVNFFRSVYAKKLECLEHAFVMGVSEDLAVLEGKERQEKLAQFRHAAAKVFVNLSKAEKAHAEVLLNQIKPELYD